MQIAGCVAHVMSNKSWSPSEYLIKFKQPTEKTLEERTREAKAVWSQRLSRNRR
jgi:hypothetical protein